MSSVQAYASRTGWIMLAAIVMFAVGALRLISGISYLVDSHKVNDLTVGLFGDNMWLWGIWDLGIAALAFWAFERCLAAVSSAGSSVPLGDPRDREQLSDHRHRPLVCSGDDRTSRARHRRPRFDAAGEIGNVAAARYV